MAITIKKKPSVQPIAQEKTYSQISQEIFNATTAALKKPGGVKLVFGGKKATPKEDDLTERQKEALIAQGLYDAPKKIPPPIQHKPSGVKAKFKIDDEVVVSQDLFPWVPTRRLGDTGRVIAEWPAPASIPEEERAEYHMYIVRLDKPRTKGGEEVSMRGWELERTR